MDVFVTVCWVLLALIHFFPSLSFFVPSLISKLYGVQKTDPVFVLMRHRAALFVIVFAIAIYAAIHVPIRPVGCFVLGFSMLSFVYAYISCSKPQSLRKIFYADLFGIALLLVVGSDSLGLFNI